MDHIKYTYGYTIPNRDVNSIIHSINDEVVLGLLVPYINTIIANCITCDNMFIVNLFKVQT